MANYGYAGEILKIDLSPFKVSKLATADYADRFLGGKGIASKLYWDMVPAQAKAFDPENLLICMTGPTAGFNGFASGRWVVCGKTMVREPESFCFGNLGGSWGIRLKQAGYDGVAVQGKAEKPVYIYIHDSEVEIKDASHLWGKSTFDTIDALKAKHGKPASVLTIGPAAENLVTFATLFADEGASGGGGTGSIMGSKKLKAIVVAGNNKPVAADPEKLKLLAGQVYEITKGPSAPRWWVIPGRTKRIVCHGCVIGCTRQSYIEDGKLYKCYCQAIDAYRRPALKFYNGYNDVILLSLRLHDGWGLDTSVMQSMIEWMNKCYRQGILTEKDTGLPLSKLGSVEYIETLTRKIALREGFGDLLAQGTLRAAEQIGGEAKKLISLSLLNSSSDCRDYEPRLILHNAMIIATETRRALQQVHEASRVLVRWLELFRSGETGPLTPEFMEKMAERYWGSAASADYSSYEGKALASKRIQDRAYAMESLILCDARWPMIQNATAWKFGGGPALAAQILSAVTGRKMDEFELESIGERNFNLHRANLVRQGWGAREGDRLLDFYHDEPFQYIRYDRDLTVPGKNGEIKSRKNFVVERNKFEKLKDEYYSLRGWDVASGLQTKATMKKLQLEDVAAGLDKRGLLV